MRGERPKILIVDDERLIADTFAVIFSSAGYDARSAYSAEAAIEIIPEWSPDLAVVDVILPRTNGIELAVFLKEQLPACRILLLSGQPAADDLLAKAATEGHTFPILAKPLHPRIMLESASELLTRNEKS